MRFNANSAWFTFVVDGSPDLAMYEFSGREHISEPYTYQIEVVSPFTSMDIGDLIGREACLRIGDRSGGQRLVHGVVSNCDFLHAANLRSHYRCRLVPRL